MIVEPFPSLDELVASMADAGRRLAAMSASEGAAGNISLGVGWPLEVRRRFPDEANLALPAPVPTLAGWTLLVTGSGRRLAQIGDDPGANLAAIVIGPDGREATMRTSPGRRFGQPTSELNSHVAVHADQAERTGTNFLAVVHAQPFHLTFLSHVRAYRDRTAMTRQLLRWEPETVVHLPEGIDVLEFLVPGSAELERATVRALASHRLVVWSKHGVMVRSDHSAGHAVDLVEYAETAARYEVLDRSTGAAADGLTDEELGAVVRSFSVSTTWF